MAFRQDDYDYEYQDITEKILRLSDELSEDIILTNITDQLENDFDLFADKINYVSLYRNKYNNITPKNSFYDKEYLAGSLEKISETVSELLMKRYGITLGTDLDYYAPDEYLKDIETLYEFLFIRQFDNLIAYFQHQLNSKKDDILTRYSELIQEPEHIGDVFVKQARRKFKNFDDVIIMHFINQIIDDILVYTPSGYVLFDTIVNIDPFEEYNERMGELLENYGNKIVFKGDKDSYDKYMSILNEQDTRNELRNHILMKYLENVEILY